MTKLGLSIDFDEEAADAEEEVPQLEEATTESKMEDVD
jgi:hypothetical protein